VYLYLNATKGQTSNMPTLNLTIGPLALFAFVASITPGPNNLMLMRSGAMFGVRRSLLHIFGIQAGFGALVVLSYLGVAALLLALPAAVKVLQWICFLYLLWLAWLILRDAHPRPATATSPAAHSRPLSFVEGMLFQLVNPKAWMMAVTVANAFYGGAAPSYLDLTLSILICLCIGGPCMLIWTIWGAAIDRVLRQPRARQLFSYVMALLVALTAVWMIR
jgi:threonine/homoserine/homoserine lactone efflux protein